MRVEQGSDAVQLICGCGHHRTVSLQILKGRGPSDTQPINPVPKPKGMSEVELRKARARMMEKVYE